MTLALLKSVGSQVGWLGPEIHAKGWCQIAPMSIEQIGTLDPLQTIDDGS